MTPANSDSANIVLNRWVRSRAVECSAMYGAEGIWISDWPAPASRLAM